MLIPSCLKSWATLLPLTGSESSMGVWMTCRSPAPNVIVLCRLRKKKKKREKRDYKGGEKNNKDFVVFWGKKNQGFWQRALITVVRVWRAAWSATGRDGQRSQKLSKYITNQTQADSSWSEWMELRGTPCQRPYNKQQHIKGRNLSNMTGVMCRWFSTAVQCEHSRKGDLSE